MIPKRNSYKINNGILYTLILSIVVIIIITLIVAIPKGSKAPVGTWVYDQYTQYVFEKDKSGCLKVDDVIYDYKYEITGDKLSIDFTDNIVRDCEYTFSVKGNQLTLIGGENTDGGTYKLKKK